MTNTTQAINTLELTDTELKALNDMVRQSKLTVTAEELVMVKLGRSQSPIMDVTLKVASLWETRQVALQNPQAPTSEQVATEPN